MGRHGGKGRVSDRLANQGCRVLGCDLAIRNRFVWAVAKHHLLDKHRDSVNTRSLALQCANGSRGARLAKTRFV